MIIRRAKTVSQLKSPEVEVFACIGDIECIEKMDSIVYSRGERYYECVECDTPRRRRRYWWYYDY